MGNIRFRRSVKIAPGVKINLNKNSISTTFGPKGMHYTISSNGKTTKSVGVPGTGLYYMDHSNIQKDKQIAKKTLQKKQSDRSNESAYGSKKAEQIKTTEGDEDFYKKPVWIFLLLLVLPPVGVYLIWAYTEWNKVIKGLISAVIIVAFLLFVGTIFVANHEKDNHSSIPNGATVIKVDGTWGLYKNNELVSDYNGLAENEYGTWVIRDGIVDFTFNGPYSYENVVYSISNGKVIPNE